MDFSALNRIVQIYSAGMSVVLCKTGRRRLPHRRLRARAAVLAAYFAFQFFILAAPLPKPLDTTRVQVGDLSIGILLTNYHGWSNSIVLNNGVVEATIVPAVGRIMQFKFVGSTNGPFWENHAMLGQAPSSTSWSMQGSFGGDKIWPAPQSLWKWPPPRPYDSMPVKATVAQATVSLESPADPVYGRCVRQVELDPHEPVMRVVSRIEKPTGPAARVSVWTITQMRDAQQVFMRVPEKSIFTNQHVLLSNGLPFGFKRSDGMISLKRDPLKPRKIGGDGDSVLWVGDDCMLLMECPRHGDAKNYPDGGCSVEVYTNPDPAHYIELETLGPLEDDSSSDPITVTNTYTLFHRSAAEAVEEAERIFNRKR